MTPSFECDRPPRALLFDGPLSTRGYVLNKFGWSLTRPANRERYRADPRGYMRTQGLTARQIELVETEDWPALLEDGGSVYVLAKLSIFAGGNLMHVGARMRGETTADFQRHLASPARLVLEDRGR